jgi:hypothetical protein
MARIWNDEASMNFVTGIVQQNEEASIDVIMQFSNMTRAEIMTFWRRTCKVRLLSTIPEQM